jgi:hypothetical protein
MSYNTAHIIILIICYSVNINNIIFNAYFFFNCFDIFTWNKRLIEQKLSKSSILKLTKRRLYQQISSSLTNLWRKEWIIICTKTQPISSMVYLLTLKKFIGFHQAKICLLCSYLKSLSQQNPSETISS